MKTVKIPVIARNEATRQSSFFKSISQFVTVFCIALVFSDALMAAERVPFSQRNPANTRNIYGEVTSIGNIVVCKKSGSVCVDDSDTNNESNMLYVNVDGGTGIFNASTAGLSIPAGATVKWAGLYWQGMISKATLDIGTGNLCTVFDTSHRCTKSNTKPTTADVGTNRYESDKVLLKKDAGTYSKITATQFDYKYETTDGARSYYNAFAEVTSLVQSGGNYTVANLQSQEGQYDKVQIGGNYGGWALFVIYEKDGLPFKNISVFDGYKGIISTGANPYKVDISGFQAPCGTVPVNAQSIVFAGEGDISYGGDSLTFTQTNLTGTPISVSANMTGINLSNNIFDSSINGTFSRSPNITNTKGNDLDTFDIGATGRDIFTNGQTATRASFSSGLDRYFPSVFAFSIDTYSPAFDVVQKSVTNTTPDHTVAQPYVNDILKYAIHFENNGNAEASNARFEDTMPLAADYDGSLLCTKTASNGTQTSCASTCTLPSAANGYKLVCPLATVAAGEDYDISFNIKVRNTLRSDGVTTTKNTPISNQGYVYFKNGAACGVSVPEEHVSTNIAETGNINVITLPPYQNEYGCGMFGSVLTSYDLISSGAVHPANNDQACYTGSISYPETKMIGELTCNPTGCGGSAVCERVDPPANKLEYTVNVSSKLGISEGIPAGTLSGVEYGDFSGSFDMTLSPSTTYGPMNTPVMVLGDVTLTSSNTLTLAPGDYFFNSITFTQNNPSIVISGGGPVRIFINNNLTVEKNGLNINASGIPDNLFVYIRGNLEALTNGAVEIWKGFFYIEGSAKIDANSNKMALYGGITAEGSIVIEGNNGNFYQQGNSSNLGYGDCQLCYGAKNESGFGFGGFQLLPKLVIPIHNISPVTLENVEVFETYKSNATFSVFGTKKVVNESGTTIGTADTISTADYNFANIANVSLKTDGINYHLGDNYAPNGYPSNTYRATYSSALVSMNMDFNTWKNDVAYFSTYTDTIGRNYNSIKLGICEDVATPAEITYLTGPFDAWDTLRGDTNGDGILDDKNISTKIANQNFNLTIASLNAANTALQAKPSGVKACYRLIDTNTSAYLTDEQIFDANATSSITASFKAASASKNVKVEFKYCADYDGTYFLLKPDASCTAVCSSQTVTTNNHPCFRKTYSNDAFAIRPEKFEIVSTHYDWANILRAGEEYNTKISAYDFATANLTQGYNVLNANAVFAFATKKYNNIGAIDVTMMGIASFGGVDFNMTNGISTKEGAGVNEVAGISFDNVGKINLSVEDQTWSEIDNDDTQMDCTVGGTYICGNVDVTFIPHHFDFNTLTLTNNNGNPGSFTYIANEVAQMSGRIDTQMRALNKAGGVTTNFATAPLWENPVTVVPVVIQPTYLHPNAIETTIAAQTIGFGTGADAKGTKTVPWNEVDATKYLRFNFQRDINLPQNSFDIVGTNLDISVKSNYADPNTGHTAIVQGSRLGAGVADPLTSTVVLPANGTSTFVYGRIIPRDIRVFGAVMPVVANGWHEVFNAPTIGATALAPSRNGSGWFVNSLHIDPNDGDGDVLIIDTYANPVGLNTTPNAVNGIEEYAFGAMPEGSYKAHIQTAPWLWYGVNALVYANPAAVNLNCLTHPCFNINVVPQIISTGSAKSTNEGTKGSKASSNGGNWTSTSDYAPAIR